MQTNSRLTKHSSQPASSQPATSRRCRRVGALGSFWWVTLHYTHRVYWEAHQRATIIAYSVHISSTHKHTPLDGRCAVWCFSFSFSSPAQSRTEHNRLSSRSHQSRRAHRTVCVYIYLLSLDLLGSARNKNRTSSTADVLRAFCVRSTIPIHQFPKDNSSLYLVHNNNS